MWHQAIGTHNTLAGPVWEFSGTVECPTFYPSMLSRWGQWNEERQAYDQIVCHTLEG